VTTAPITNGRAAATAAAPSAASPELAKLKKAAQAFEAVFLRQMIGSMRSAGLGDGIFDSSATQQFQQMSDAATADAMASKGALHIADMLVKQYGARLSATAAPASAANAKPADPAATDVKAAK
jgi:peptidoglycan hydrolase FlgJ